MEISPLVLIFWGEVTFLMAGALIVIGVSTVVKKRKGRKYLSQMFASVTSDRDNRKKQIREGLASYGLEGDNLENKVAEIDKQERLLYKRIAHMYNKRSDMMLSNLPVAVEATTKPYLELNLTVVPTEAGAEGSSDIDSEEFRALKEENERLQDELGVTMETIGRMLSEYSSMFGSDEEADLDKSKIMEAFEVGEESGMEEEISDEDVMDETGDIEDLDIVSEDEVDVEDLEIEEGMSDTLDEVVSEDIPDSIPDDDDLGAAVDVDESADDIDLDDVSVSDVDIDDLLNDVALDKENAGSEDEMSAEDIDDLLDEEAVPDDELLEIDDEPLLDSVDLGDDADDVLSEIVDLEENFGEDKTEKEKPEKDLEKDLDDDISDLDIDALLSENKK